MFSVQNMLASWKTSLMGLPLILTSLSGVIEIILSDAPWYSIFGSNEFKTLLVGLGLLFAKDSDKTNSSNPVTVARPAPAAVK